MRTNCRGNGQDRCATTAVIVHQARNLRPSWQTDEGHSTCPSNRSLLGALHALLLRMQGRQPGGSLLLGRVEQICEVKLAEHCHGPALCGWTAARLTGQVLHSLGGSACASRQLWLRVIRRYTRRPVTSCRLAS